MVTYSRKRNCEPPAAGYGSQARRTRAAPLAPTRQYQHQNERGECHMRHLYFAVMLTATLLAASCASHQVHSDNWIMPESVEGENCPDISGQYMNSGETSDKKPVQLKFQWFWKDLGKYPVPLENWREVHQISIRQEGTNQLEIAAVSDGGTIYSEIMKKESDDFSCQDGWLRIQASTGFGVSSAMSSSHYIRSFAKADGYLIEKEEYNSFSLVLIIPITGSGTRWYRFSRFEDRGFGAPVH